MAITDIQKTAMLKTHIAKLKVDLALAKRGGSIVQIAIIQNSINCNQARLRILLKKLKG